MRFVIPTYFLNQQKLSVKTFSFIPALCPVYLIKSVRLKLFNVLKLACVNMNKY